MARSLVPANPRGNADIESLSLKIIQKYQPDVLTKIEPFDIERFFDLHLEDLTGVTSDYKILPEGVYGYTDTEKMECVISANLAEDTNQEKFFRSTMAHEIGHAVMHVKDYRAKKAVMKFLNESEQLRTFRQEEIILYKNPEWQAMRFAAAILMPEMSVRKAANAGSGVQYFADMFNVNPAFARSRLKALKI